MTSSNPPQSPKLIHAARIQRGWKVIYLFLRQIEPQRFAWFEERSDGNEVETDLAANNVEEALRIAHMRWKNEAYRNVNCGYRFTLPERDEHGQNALFHEMVASYASMNGQYFDPEVGHTCIVHNASQEARDLQKRLAGKEKQS